jgi:hypothetical protein
MNFLRAGANAHREKRSSSRQHHHGLCLVLPLLTWAVFVMPAEAARVRILGLNTQWPLETRSDLGSNTGDVLDERIPLGAFRRFGVQFELAGDGLWLSRGSARLEHVTTDGWRGTTAGIIMGLQALAAPIRAEDQFWLPIRTLAYLGFNLRLEGSNIVIEPALDTPELPNQIVQDRVTRGRNTRFVFDLARSAQMLAEVSPGKVRVVLTNTLINPVPAPRVQTIGTESVSRWRWLQAGTDAVLEVETALRSSARAFALTDPDRVVIDADAPDELPPAPGIPADGVNISSIGENGAKLQLVSVDPTRFRPALVTAPWGGLRSVFEYAGRAGAVVAVNGGYFDPVGGLPVDLGLSGGALLAYARGNRATLGLLDDRVIFGSPRVRAQLVPDGQAALNLNAITPRPNPNWLTTFTGDGFVPTGAAGFKTLVLGPGAGVDGLTQTVITHVALEPFVPDAGQVTVSFKPEVFPALDRLPIGTPVRLGLVWSEPAWANVTHALAAGPMLVRGGQYAVNPQLEGFDTRSEIWRSTRQVAFGLDAQGRYKVAMLEQGTPEEFARALQTAGVRDAIRLDSGSSAAVFVAGGMLSGRWGRTVPNALVFVPR